MNATNISSPSSNSPSPNNTSPGPATQSSPSPSSPSPSNHSMIFPSPSNHSMLFPSPSSRPLLFPSPSSRPLLFPSPSSGPVLFPSPSSRPLLFPSPSSPSLSSPSMIVVDNGLIIPQIAAVLFLCAMVIATIFRKKILKMALDYNRGSYNTVDEYEGEFPSDLPQIDVFSNTNLLQLVPETELTTKRTETETFNSSEEV